MVGNCVSEGGLEDINLKKCPENSSWHADDGELSWNNCLRQPGKAVQAGLFPGVGGHSAQAMSITRRAGGEWRGLAGWKLEPQKPPHLGFNPHLYNLVTVQKGRSEEPDLLSWKGCGRVFRKSLFCEHLVQKHQASGRWDGLAVLFPINKPSLPRAEEPWLLGSLSSLSFLSLILHLCLLKVIYLLSLASYSS